MAEELMVFQDLDADLHFHYANGTLLMELMDQWVFQELIAKLLLFQLVTPNMVVSQVETVLLELQALQWLLFKKKTEILNEEAILKEMFLMNKWSHI